MTTLPAHAAIAEYPGTVADHRVRGGWGAIMAGAVTAIGLQFLFTALGIALGVTVADASAMDAGSWGVAASAWWLVSGTISLFVGGLVAGRSTDGWRTEHVWIAGATMWGVVALFGFFVVWSGAGVGAASATPFAAMSVGYGQGQSDTRSMTRPEGSEIGTTGVTGAMSSAAPVNREATLNEEPATRAAIEEARSVAQTASWWTVVGLIAGVGAAIGGSFLGSKPYASGVRRARHTPPPPGAGM